MDSSVIREPMQVCWKKTLKLVGYSIRKYTDYHQFSRRIFVQNMDLFSAVFIAQRLHCSLVRDNLPEYVPRLHMLLKYQYCTFYHLRCVSDSECFWDVRRWPQPFRPNQLCSAEVIAANCTLCCLCHFDLLCPCEKAAILVRRRGFISHFLKYSALTYRTAPV